jgi:AAA15 family ATPase/GTPase
MQLKSLSVNHHAVLGTRKINFFENSEPLGEKVNEPVGDIYLEIEDASHPNKYTFIIGDNGIGKSVLLKSIIYHVNFASSQGSRLADVMGFSRDNSKYEKLAFFDDGLLELQNLGVQRNLSPYVSENPENDILKTHDGQLIFITSVYDQKIIHRNERFRSFNYLSAINETKIVFLRAWRKYLNDSKLTNLSKLLGEDTISWRLTCGLSVAHRGDFGNGTSAFLLSADNRYSIYDFFDLLNNIKIGDDQKVDGRSIGENYRLFDDIYESGAFFKLYYDSGLLLKEVFHRIKDSYVIKRILNFLEKDVDSSRGRKTLNITVTDKQKDGWDKMIADPTALSEFDINILSLLQYLRFLEIDIYANDVSIDKLSSGQKNLIRLFSFFSDLPVPGKLDNLVVLFDEPENSLHPKWQQDFPVNFKSIVEFVYGITNSHFIFTTHSPVLIMKSALIPDSNVLRFYKDEQGQFAAESVKSVNAFSIEEILLDEFQITYRDQGAESEMKKILDGEFIEKTKNNDPVNAIKNSLDLRNKINDLFNDIQKGV